MNRSELNPMLVPNLEDYSFKKKSFPDGLEDIQEVALDNSKDISEVFGESRRDIVDDDQIKNIISKSSITRGVYVFPMDTEAPVNVYDNDVLTLFHCPYFSTPGMIDGVDDASRQANQVGYGVAVTAENGKDLSIIRIVIQFNHLLNHRNKQDLIISPAFSIEHIKMLMRMAYRQHKGHYNFLFKKQTYKKLIK